jgi:hypothetical protein
MQTFLDQKPIKLPEENQFHLLAQRGIGHSLEEGLLVAEQYARTFVSMEQGAGIGLSEFLHGVNFSWAEFDKEEGDTFWDWADRATGRAVATVQRDVCMWEWLSGDYIPAGHRNGIEAFSVKMLKKAYKISVRHKKNKYTGQYDFEPSGYDVEPADWLALSECVDDAMLVGVMDKITGRDPNSNRMSFKFDANNGEIWFYRGKKDSAVIGQLNIINSSALVKDGIAELLDRAGIGELNDA